MSAAECGLRVGCVPYLNARPLVEGLDGISFDVPAVLARRLAEGELDAALVPVMACLDRTGYRLVDGVGIACDGAVRSVIVAPWPVAAGRPRVALDADSRTSNELARLMLGDAVEWEPAGSAADAHVRIGDPALAWRAQNPGVSVLDLGEAWRGRTGLPFVFAVWAVAEWVPEAAARDLAERLRRAHEAGIRAMDRIAPDAAAREYLTRHIVHRVGAREKRGLDRFQQDLLDAGRLSHKQTWCWL